MLKWPKSAFKYGMDWRAINNTCSADNFQLLRIAKELLTHGEVCVGGRKHNDLAMKQGATHRKESLGGFQVFVHNMGLKACS